MFSLERERLAGLGPLPLHLHAGVPARPEGRAGPGRGAARLGERPAGAALRQAAPAGLAAQQLGLETPSESYIIACIAILYSYDSLCMVLIRYISRHETY